MRVLKDGRITFVKVREHERRPSNIHPEQMTTDDFPDAHFTPANGPVLGGGASGGEGEPVGGEGP